MGILGLLKKAVGVSNDSVANGLILGIGHKVTDESNKLAVTVPYHTLSRHVYLLGATGSGKTVFLRNTVYQLIKAGYGVLLVDPKGENDLMWDMWRGCVEAERKEDFIYFSPVLSEKFMTKTAEWNPLIMGDANVVASRLMDAFGNDDPAAQFYEKIKYDILFAVTSCMKEIGKVFTLRDMAFAMQDITSMRRLAALTPQCQGKRLLHTILSDWEENPKVFITYIKGTKIAIQEMATGLSGNICNAITPTIDMSDVVEKKKVVYCYLPTMYAKDSMRGIGKMMLSELKNVFANIQAYSAQKARFAIIIDEFEEFVFKAVKDLFNKARSAGVSMVVGHQTIADVNYETKSSEFAKSLLDNTAVKLIMQIKSKESAEMLSSIIGEYPPMPFFDKWIKIKHIVHPDTLMGKNEIHEQGLEVGEMIARIDADVFRVKVPYTANRDKIIPGKDIPKPIHEYHKYYYGEPLNLENTKARG